MKIIWKCSGENWRRPESRELWEEGTYSSLIWRITCMDNNRIWTIQILALALWERSSISDWHALLLSVELVIYPSFPSMISGVVASEVDTVVFEHIYFFCSVPVLSKRWWPTVATFVFLHPSLDVKPKLRKCQAWGRVWEPYGARCGVDYARVRGSAGLSLTATWTDDTSTDI